MEALSITIESTNCNKLSDIKEVEENKYEPVDLDDFPKQREDDYIACQKELPQCPAANRIAYLLKCLKDCNNLSFPIYEQLSKLHQHYHICNVMDDWCHIKTVHLSNTNNHHYFENNTEINCTNGKDCHHVRRYQRERRNDTYIDHKNDILIDQLDSIHTYLYHESPMRFRNELQNKYNLSLFSENESDMPDHESDNEPKTNDINIYGQYEKASFLLNNLKSISNCDVDQIIFILENDIMQHLETLHDHKLKIYDYIKEQGFDGNKFANTSRKEFITQLVTKLGDKKLTMQTAKLYSQVTNYDISKFLSNIKNQKDSSPQKNNLHDIWLSNPQLISKCNTHQIAFIVETDIINKLNKLQPLKTDIIDFIKDNKFDGAKLNAVGRKQFIAELSIKFNNKKLRAQLGKLYTDIMNYDLSPFVKFSTNESATKAVNHISNTKNSKFVSSTGNSNDSYYAFGEQYRYTRNLSHHHLYIQPKYKSIKEELIHYFERTN
eukprot:68222_1